MIEQPLYLLLNNKSIDFKFMLIWEYKNWNSTKNFQERENFNINKELNEDLFVKLINDIKDYIQDHRYIRINKKALLGLYISNKTEYLIRIIKILRKKAKEFGIGELFITIFLNNNSFNYLSGTNFFNNAYKSRLNNFFLIDHNESLNIKIIYKYANYEEKELYFSKNKNIMHIFDNYKKNKDSCFLEYYFSPEQFYMIIRIIIEYNIKIYEPNKRFFFVNIWNEFYEQSSLEPKKKLGFAYLNSLSKALFNLSFIYNYNLLKLQQLTKIAIQVHVYYEELIIDIIHKVNCIPVNFDLFISTDSEYKKKFIYNYILNNSKANKFEIRIMNNKGRDVLPLLTQLNNHIKKYKYFCHLHTKKSKHINFGDEWRNYLFNNLLGNSDIISEILTEFENNNHLGIIFPEVYYKVFETFGKNILGSNLKYMNSLIIKFAPYLRLSTNNLDFPMGNMFWARVKSVYQIFFIKFYEQIPPENKQLDGTLFHGIERIWLYLVKYNGYYYKKIFKHL